MGKMRRARAQLRERRRRGLRRRAGRGRRGDQRARASATAPGLPAHAACLLGRHTGGGHASGRSTPRSGRRARPARWSARLASHVAYYERWAQDLGVPGAAQGPAGRRRPRRSGRAYVDAVAPLVWDGCRAPRLRRGRPGDAPPGRAARSRPPRPTASSSSGRVACATSSSRCSCSSSCTGGATRPCGPATTLEALGGAGRRRLCRPRRRADAGSRPTGSCARSSTGSSCYRLRRTHLMPDDEADLRRLGAVRSASRHDPVAELDRGVAHALPARSDGCTRSCSTGRCCRRSRRLPAGRGPAHAGDAASTARGARLRRPGRCAAAHRGAHLAASRRRAAIQRTLLPVHARLVRGRRRTPTPGCSASVGSATRSAPPPWYLRLLRDEGVVGRAARPLLASQPVRDRPAPARARGGRDARRRRRACSARAGALDGEVLATAPRATTTRTRGRRGVRAVRAPRAVPRRRRRPARHWSTSTQVGRGAQSDSPRRRSTAPRAAVREIEVQAELAARPRSRVIGDGPPRRAASWAMAAMPT